MDTPLVSRTLSWARLAAAKIACSKAKLCAYLVAAYLLALLASHLLGETFDVTKVKLRGPPVSRPARQAAASPLKQPDVDPFANRPYIGTQDGHLEFRAAQDRDINFKTSGPRGSITLNGHRLDPIIGVSKAFEKSRLTRFGGEADPQDQYDGMLRSVLDTVSKVEIMQARLDALKTRLQETRNQTRRLRKSLDQRDLALTKLRETLEETALKLRRNDCFDANTGRPVCANGATCVDQFESYKCLCPDQYEGDRCELDVNECQRFKGTDLGCQNGGKCVNLVGGYRCECPAQFHGVHCTEQHNDCSLSSSAAMCGHGKCVTLARTQLDQPSFECICDQGWTTDGRSPACQVDVNECLAGLDAQLVANLSVHSWLGQPAGLQAQLADSNVAYPCSQNPFVDCINLPGSFRCGPCPRGYAGNGRVCRDIDECLEDNGGCSRSPRVECINLPGTRKCGPCPAGYTSSDDSATCLRVSVCEREPNGGCDPMARCVEVAGVADPDAARLCVCNYPYTGRGVGPGGCTLFGSLQALGADPVVLQAEVASPSGPQPIGADYDTGHLLPAPNQTALRDECNPNPCQNDGKCLKVDQGIECICTSQWVGSNCERVNRLACGGFIMTTSSGVFEFPLGGSYGSLLADAGQTSRPKQDERQGLLPAANKPKQANCTWTLSAPLGKTLRLVFADVKAAKGKNVLTYTNAPVPGGGKERLRSELMSHWGCSEQLDVRERLFEGPVEPNPRDDPDRLIARLCVTSAKGTPESANQPSTNVSIDAESSAVELTYSIVGSGQQPLEPTLAFALRWQHVQPPCGQTILPGTDSGSLSSPNFPDFYPPGIECRYLLRVSPDKRIRIQLDELNLLHSATPSRCGDLLIIEDGALAVQRQILFQHCAGQESAVSVASRDTAARRRNIISSSSTVEVVLVSRTDTLRPAASAKRQKYGFHLTYESEAAEPTCSGLFSGRTGEIKSADYRDVPDSSQGSGDDPELAYEFARYFDFKPAPPAPSLPPTNSTDEADEADEAEAADSPSTRTSANQTAPLTTRCEYEIRPADQSRNHHVQIDWVELPISQAEPLEPGRLMGARARRIRCQAGRLMIFNGKPRPGERVDHDDPNLVATFCSGDKYDSSLVQLKSLVSEGHVLFAVYESEVAPELSRGFLLRYKTVCLGIYTQLQGQIQTDLDHDIRACLYHIRVPVNNTLSFVTGPLTVNQTADSPESQLLQQQAALQSLWLPDGACVARALVIDGAVPGGLTGLAHSQRLLRGFEFSDKAAEPSEADQADDSRAGQRRRPRRSDSRANLAGSEDDEPDIQVSADAAGPRPSRRAIHRYGSSKSHDIKEFEVCQLPAIQMNSAWNEISIVFRLNTRLAAPAAGTGADAPPPAKFVITYRAEAACGGIVSQPRGVLALAAGGQCAWVLRNPQPNLTIWMSFDQVPAGEIAKQRAEWIKWLRERIAKTTARPRPTSTISSYEDYVREHDIEMEEEELMGRLAWHRRNSSQQLQSATNCSQAFSELIELYEPSASRTRIICPGELVDEPLAIWSTVSDIVHVRLINQANASQPSDAWPGRKPLPGMGQLKLRFAMETPQVHASSAEDFVCGGRLLQSSGRIKTPRHPFNYPADLSCVWIIQAPAAGQQVRLNFSRFQLEPAADCVFDSLEIRAGPTESSPLMGRFCGRQLESRVLVSQSSTVRLWFRSDRLVGQPGFRLTFDAAATSCGAALTAVRGQIDSPDYPHAYAHSADCEWTIEVNAANVIVLNVTDLDLGGAPGGRAGACQLDGPRANYLEVIEVVGQEERRSLGRWCHRSQLENDGQLVSGGNKLLIVYRGLAQDQGRGFRLGYAAACSNERALTGTGGVIESPGFPAGWSEREDEPCFWVIRAPLGSNLTVTVTDYSGPKRSIAEVVDFINLLLPPDFLRNNTSEMLLAGARNESSCGEWNAKLRFWSGRVLDPAVPATERLRPISANYILGLLGARVDNATRQPKAQFPPYTFQLERTLCSEAHFGMQPPSWRTFDLTGGANLLVVGYTGHSRRFRLEWRARTPCGQPLQMLRSERFIVEGIRFDQRMNLSSLAARQPVECLWLISAGGPAAMVDLDLSADMRQLSAGTAASCNESALQVYDGLDTRAGLLYENCNELRNHEVVSSNGAQVLLRYFSAGVPPAAARSGSVGQHFTLLGYRTGRDGCKHSVLDPRRVFRKTVGELTSPNYPDRYDPRRNRCIQSVGSQRWGRVRFTIQELDIPVDDGDSGDSAASEFAQSTGGFVDARRCLNTQNFLLIRQPYLEPNKVFCGRFDRSSGLGTAVGDSLARSVFVSEIQTQLEFSSRGNARGRWRVTYDVLCGGRVHDLTHQSEQLTTPNYPARPQWPNSSLPADPLTEDVCIWRISARHWFSWEKDMKIHFSLLNLVGATDEAPSAAAAAPADSSSPTRDCLRVYEGSEISLQQSVYNLTEIDAKYEQRIRVCLRKDLRASSMVYMSRGSEITVVTTGQLVAKFEVKLIENHCGGEFALPMGEFSSPDYPQPYKADLDCHYFISGSPGSRVDLTFDNFELAEPDPADLALGPARCDSTDFVEIRTLSTRRRFEARVRKQANLFQYHTASASSSESGLHVSLLDYLATDVEPHWMSLFDADGQPIPTTSPPPPPRNLSAATQSDSKFRARLKSLDRLLELAHIFHLFEDSRGGQAGSIVSSQNAKLAINLEDFYAGSKLIGRYCGKKPPQFPPGLLRDDVLVRLLTGRRPDLSDAKTKRQPQGFMANYRLASGGLISFTTDKNSWGFISSPGYPERVAHNTSITWTLETELGAIIELDLVSLHLGSVHSDCRDSLSVYEGYKPKGNSPLLVRLCGHLSFKRLLDRLMRPLWQSALEGKVSPRRVPVNLAHDPHVQANLLRRYRTGSNVASVVFENYQSEGAFLMRYRTVLPAKQNDSQPLDLLEQPVEVDESLGEQFGGSLWNHPDGLQDTAELDQSCSKVIRLTPSAGRFNASANDSVQLMSPHWPSKPPERALECQWLLTASENTNVVLQVAPSYDSTGAGSGSSLAQPFYSPARFSMGDRCLRAARGSARNYVVVYDGASKLANVLTSVCLPSAPLQLESTGRYMLVRYVHVAGDPGPADTSYAQYSGRSPLFRAQAHVGRCGGQYHVTSTAWISDRSRADRVDQYADNLDCFYYLFAANPERRLAISAGSEFRLASMPTNANCTVGDYIEVRELPIASDQFDYSPEAATGGRSHGRFCAGHPLEAIHSTGSGLVVEFRTDAQNAGPGFVLSVSSILPDTLCSRSMLSLDSDEFARLNFPRWPLGLPGKLTCRYGLIAPRTSSILVQFVRLKRPAAVASPSGNGSLVCKDSLIYLDDNEAPAIRSSFKPLREIKTLMSGTKLRDIITELPCPKYDATGLDASADLAVLPADNQTRFIETISGAEHARLLNLRGDQALPTIRSNSRSLVFEYTADGLLPGQGFVAVARVEDRPAERPCGGQIVAEPGKNLIESPDFGKPANESDPYVQCLWQLKYSNHAHGSRTSRFEFGLLRERPAAEYSYNSFLLLQVLEIPSVAPNATLFASIRSMWSQAADFDCGLSKLLLSDEFFYQGATICGFLPAPTWIILDPYNDIQVLLRTKNVERTIYGRWPATDGLSAATWESRKKLFRGVRAYFHETVCPAATTLMDKSLLVVSHSSLNDSSYQPGICRWTLGLGAGRYLFKFTKFNLRPGEKAAPSKPDDGLDSSCYAEDDDVGGTSDYVEIRESSDPDSPVLNRFCARNQAKAQNFTLHLNASLSDLTVVFVAGIKQLAQGQNKIEPDNTKATTKAGETFGFELLLAKVQNSSLNEFCQRSSQQNFYTMVRPTLHNLHVGNLKPNVRYAKNAHCLIDMSIDANYKFNFTFVSFFDMEPSPGCKNDYFIIHDLVEKTDKLDASTTSKPRSNAKTKQTRRPTTSRRPTSRTSTFAPSNTTTPAPIPRTTPKRSRIVERMSLNLQTHLEPVPIGRWCGRSLPKGTFFSKGNKVRLEFHSNDYVEGKGFMLQWSAIPASDDPGLDRDE